MADDVKQLVASDELAIAAESSHEPATSPAVIETNQNNSSLLQSTASNLMDSTEVELNRVRAQRISPTMLRNIISMTILTIINLLNYMDRYSIAGVLKKVMDYYDIDNTTAGLIQTSFVVSYMLLSPLFGYLGDRYTRKYIMAGGIFFWSLFTLASSFIAQDQFGVFLLMRALVGVGEASYSTIAPTIIADLFVGDARTKALTAFYFAIPVGSGLGYIVGSKMAAGIGGLEASSFKWALRFTPGLGFLSVVLILLFLKEPRRGAADNSEHLTSTSYLSDVKYLLKNKSFVLSTCGFTCVAFVAGALALWAPNYIYNSILSRPQEIKEDSVSEIFGYITCVAGIVGVVSGTMSARKLRQYTDKADPYVCAFGLLASSVFLYLSLCTSRYNTAATWIFILIGETLLCLNWAIITDMLLYVVIPTRRSTAEAVQILVSHILGDAGSPFLVGVISDSVTGARGSDVIQKYIGLQYALFLTAFVCVFGGGFFLFTSLFIVRDRKRVEQIIAGTITEDGLPTASSNHTTSNSRPGNLSNSGHGTVNEGAIISETDVQILPADGRIVN